MKEILDVIQNRRSIRKYKNTEPDSELIKNVLRAAGMAPSSGNSQPWQFIVARDKFARNISQEFYNFAKDYIPTASYIPEDKKKMMLEYSKDFGGAPCHIIVTYPNLEDDIKREEALKASCGAIQNLLLQASAMGLGTVWIGSRLNHSDKVKEILGIGSDRRIAGIIPIGYPDMAPAAPPREDIEANSKVKWLGY